MPTKAELYAQMADKVATQLTGSWQEWAGFLTTASRLYKYPFHEQLMIYAQRPDANILPGQIKNNMNIRICGRADTTLSTIIIGDGRAAEQIPHDAKGRFIMEDGTVFQAYYFNEDKILK